MSAGEIQLAALGMQDAYLTGTPKVTYFKGVYRRHTPFSVQSFNIPFENQFVNWGNQAICRIPYKGDMVQSTTLAVTLPLVYPVTVQFRWPVPVRAGPYPYLITSEYSDEGVEGDPTLGAIVFNPEIYWTLPDDGWLSTSVLNFIKWSSSSEKFIFPSKMASVSVYTSDVTTVGVFWGLDPNGFTSVGTFNNKSITTWHFPFNATNESGNPANFVISQSGWIKYNSYAATNPSSSLLFKGPATLGTVSSLVRPSTSQFNYPFNYINFSAFSSVIGAKSLSTNTAGGNVKFSYPGVYSFILTLTGLGVPMRVGIGHTSSDGHPVTGYTYDYVYTWSVEFADSTPIIFIPINVTDATQYYFIDIEGATGSLTADTELVVTDIPQYFQASSNVGIDENGILQVGQFTNFQGVQQNPPFVPTTAAFTAAIPGLYMLHGSFTVGTSNTISSVSLFGESLVTAWNTLQSAPTTVNFVLPVFNTSEGTSYKIIVNTKDANPLGNVIAPSSLSLENFGSFSTPTSGDFRLNGSLYQAKEQTDYPLATANINLTSVTTQSGVSYHIHTSPGGNLYFSNASQYRLTSYIETTSAAFANVTVWTTQSPLNAGATEALTNEQQALNDALFETSASLVASRSLPLGLTSGYTIDLIIPVTNFSNNYQIRVGLVGQETTTITSNTFFALLGTTSPAQPSYSYVDSVGTYLVERAELRIGGQSVQTLTGEMIEICNDLFIPQENQPGLTLLTGKLDTSVAYTPRTYYINLPFFFYGSAELSLPVCSLGLQDLEIWVQFNNFQSLLVSPGVITTPEFVVASMIVDYAYLSSPEVDWFSSHRQNYVIRQVQYDSFILSGSLTFDLNFLGPVRELYFVIQDAADAPYVYETDPSLGVTITFNGEDFIDESTMDYNFTRFIAPLKCYERQPDRTIHMIPLCRNPLNARPTGSVNMSRIYQKKFQITLPTLTSLPTKTLRILAVSYNIMRVENGLAGIMYQ